MSKSLIDKMTSGFVNKKNIPVEENSTKNDFILTLKHNEKFIVKSASRCSDEEFWIWCNSILPGIISMDHIKNKGMKVRIRILHEITAFSELCLFSKKRLSQKRMAN